MKIPDHLLYTKQHEWISTDGDEGTLGITDYAQQELGDVVFVELPAVGTHLAADEPFGSVESVKAVSEVYCPLDGEVVAINHRLMASPEIVNHSPYDEGWMIRLRLSDPSSIATLMSAANYREYVTEESEAQ